jgi:hypothetical protein
MWTEYVDSSNIEWIAYDDSSRKLFVGFLDGSEYVYFEVPGTVARHFVTADSPGGFLHAFIRNKYAYRRR